MTSVTVKITNKVGLHARPASMLINAAKQLPCTVSITKGEKTIPLNSIISLLLLSVKQGDQVTLTACGEDEDASLATLCKMIESNFGEK